MAGLLQLRNKKQRIVMKVKFITILTILLLNGCATSNQIETSSSSGFSIIPGAKIFAEAKVNSDGSIELTKMDEIKNPRITLTFDLSEMDNGMMLSVKNPLDISIKYHLNMIDYKGKAHNTSSCPVLAGLSVFEMWPHSIPEIRISNIHVALKEEEGTCIY